MFGKPFLDLGAFVDVEALARLDAEISRGLAIVETRYTGGTLKWMGVVAPWAMDDAYLDAMHVIEGLDADEFEVLASLGEDPIALRALPPAMRRLGDETHYPFTRAQERWLARRHGVYFPWKACYHLLENDRWEDKHSGAGKGFGEEAREVFPDTVRFIEALPFEEVGRAVIFGLEPNDHAPLHRDSEPGEALSIPQSISLCPRGNKRFYLQNAARAKPLVVGANAYWFNDMDYHGVFPDPFFRYSIRVDGVFERSFADALEASLDTRDDGA